MMDAQPLDFLILQFLSLALPLSYLVVRRKQRLVGASISKSMVTRSLFFVAGLVVILWLIIYDTFFVEHLPDEATLPGPVFGSVALLINTSAVMILYALYRIVAVSMRSIRGV